MVLMLLVFLWVDENLAGGWLITISALLDG